MKTKLTQAIVLQPAAHSGMQRGINQIVDAIRPTLGPQSRFVAIESVIKNKSPELLDNGGLIARRIIELPDRDADMGAMFIRSFLCRLGETSGDGTATAAVLFQSIYNQGISYLASGGNAMRLRHFLEVGAEIILEALSAMTVPLQGQQAITKIALSMCDHLPLASMLGEIFDIIGEYGQLDIRIGTGRQMDREYVDGTYWPGGSLSRALLTDKAKVKSCFDNAALLISDLSVEDPHDLIPLLEMAHHAKLSSIIIVLNKLSEKGLSLLLANQNMTDTQVVVVRLPGDNEAEQSAALEDLAVLTGAQPLLKAAGDTFFGVRPEHLGYARQAWVTREAFGVIGGKGNPRTLSAHIKTLRVVYHQTTERPLRQKLQQRIGKLLGGSATLWIGGVSQLETEAYKLIAQRIADALRGGLREGVLPGGGIALLACQPALRERLNHASDLDERAAYQLLIAALESPFHTIIANTGYENSAVMSEIRRAGSGYGFDGRSGQVVEMAQAGIFDIASVCKAAVQGAISQAALALTIDVLVHSKNRQVNLAAP